MDRAFTLVVSTLLAASVAAVASVPQPEIQSWDAVPKYEKALEANPEDVQARKLLLACIPGITRMLNPILPA
jgi:hypothetical protein